MWLCSMHNALIALCTLTALVIWISNILHMVDFVGWIWLVKQYNQNLIKVLGYHNVHDSNFLCIRGFHKTQDAYMNGYWFEGLFALTRTISCQWMNEWTFHWHAMWTFNIFLKLEVFSEHWGSKTRTFRYVQAAPWFGLWSVWSP